MKAVSTTLVLLSLSLCNLGSAKVEGTLNLQYHENYHLYTYYFSFGTPVQGLDMRVGLQSTYTYTVEKGGCASCTVYDNTFGYNRSASTSSSGYTGQPFQINTTGAQFSSYFIKDRVCLKMTDGCVDQFQFYVINR